MCVHYHVKTVKLFDIYIYCCLLYNIYKVLCCYFMNLYKNICTLFLFSYKILRCDFKVTFLFLRLSFLSYYKPLGPSQGRSGKDNLFFIV